jgi:hypothetical protein
MGIGTAPGLSARTLAQIVGAETVALAANHNGPHNHGGNTGNMSGNNPHDHPHNSEGTPAGTSGGSHHGYLTGTPGPAEVRHNVQSVGNRDINHTHSVAWDGSGDPHNNMQPSAGVNYLVKT